MRVKKWFWGVFFLVSAVLILVHQLGYLSMGDDITVQMLLLGVVFLSILVEGLFAVNFFVILMSLAALCIVFSAPLHLGAITPWPVLIAAALGSIGLHVLFGSRFGRWKNCFRHKTDKTYIPDKNTEHRGDFPAENVDGDMVEFTVRFGSSSKYLYSESLEHVNLNCSFGAVSVYFDQAKLSENGAVVDLNCSFCGAELYIPRSWKVVNQVSVSLGAVENGDNLAGSDLPALILKGNVSFGAVEVHYV